MTKRIAIIGGGITGLSLSHFLQKKNRFKIDVFEKRERLGGWIRSENVHGQIMESGPRMLRTHGSGHEILDLCCDLGIRDSIVTANSSCKTRMLIHNSNLQAFPNSLVDFVRTSIGRKFIKGILPLLFKKPKIENDLSIADFFERYTSKAFVQDFIDPLCRGIWATTPQLLSMKFCLPHILNFLEKKSFLFKRKNKKESFLFSLDEGIEKLIQILNDQSTANIHKNVEIEQIKENEEYIELVTKTQNYRADLVVCCIPSVQVQKLLPQEDPAQQYLKKIPMTSLSTCTFRFSSPLPFSAFGFLVPSQEDPDLLGVVFDSCIFDDSLGQVTCMMVNHDTVSDDELEGVALKKLKKYLKLDAQSTHTKIVRAKNAIAQYLPGHLETLSSLEKIFEPRRIRLAGSGYYGVSVGDCIRSARVIQNNL